MIERSWVRAFISKVMKDNVTMLASVVAWGVLSSVIPIVVGLIAISSLMLSDPTRQRIVINHLSQALQQVLSSDDLCFEEDLCTVCAVYLCTRCRFFGVQVSAVSPASSFLAASGCTEEQKGVLPVQ